MVEVCTIVSNAGSNALLFEMNSDNSSPSLTTLLLSKPQNFVGRTLLEVALKVREENGAFAAVTKENGTTVKNDTDIKASRTTTRNSIIEFLSTNRDTVSEL